MNAEARVIQVDAGQDLLACTAAHVIEQASTLPDLTRYVILLPDLQVAAQLRRRLLEAARAAGHDALLGPVISTPALWLAEQVTPEQAVPGRARCELLLVEAINDHPGVFREQDPWVLADSLLTLFDELTLHRVPVDADPEAFRRRLQSAYGLTGRPPEPFDHEARIVQRLWQAWHEQLQAQDLLDPAAAQLQQLATLRARHDHRVLYFVGLDDPTAAEAEWIGSVLDSGHGHLLLYGSLPGTAPTGPLAERLSATPRDADPQPAGDALASVYGTTDIAIQTRAQMLHDRYPDSPLADRLHTFAAGSPEQEALAIELQVRRWLLEGRQPIAVVTEDRRLGRRVRALLERAGVTLQDPGGWALSTTRAAAALERWLQTVEEDFAHEPLLDTLKSPFTLPDLDDAALDYCVFRFETDIVRREQIASGLHRYRRQIDARRKRRESAWGTGIADELHALLDRLEHAAEPLRACLADKHAPSQLLERLQGSLVELGIWQAFSVDPAGQRIQQECRLLQEAATGSRLQMDWSTFRAWLGSALERHDFRPAPDASPVWLLNLQQARLGRFAGIVIGACDSEHLPPAPARAPFFNDRVRTELGLPAWNDQHRRQLERFRVLLESAPQVLLTWHREQDGEQRTPSPWLAHLEVFHRLAWRHDLQDGGLAALIDHPGTRVAGHHPLALPPVTVQPRAVLAATAVPDEISVSAHGTLIDCPYRFFATSGLRLKAREEVKRELEKSEFGSLVHRALEIFHGGADGFPVPLPQPVNAAQRETALRQLEQVSRQLFTGELEDNYEHRAWLRRWLALTGPYTDWLIRHQVEWRYQSSEREGRLQLADGRVLTGRIDRIDCGGDGTLVIDYKTGNAPKQDAVDSGEAVQLPSYALLLDEAPQMVEYVLIGKQNNRDTVRDGSRLDGPALHELSSAVRERLECVLAEIAGGTPLPAWGDEDTCKYCDMDGLCRRQVWADA